MTTTPATHCICCTSIFFGHASISFILSFNVSLLRGGKKVKKDFFFLSFSRLPICGCWSRRWRIACRERLTSTYEQIITCGVLMKLVAFVVNCKVLSINAGTKRKPVNLARLVWLKKKLIHVEVGKLIFSIHPSIASTLRLFHLSRRIDLLYSWHWYSMHNVYRVFQQMCLMKKMLY